MNIISFINQKQAFPLHYHAEYCISLIRKGVELISIGAEQFMGNVNDITITHPYELHSNPLFSSTNLLSFDTIYISEEEIRSILPLHKILHFKERIIKSDELQQSFECLVNSEANVNSDTQKQLLQQFISLLSSFAELNDDSKIEKPMKSWDSLDSFIEQHIKEVISLESMANIANLNKFSFARKFKSTTGITPVHYTLMKKVFHCKEHITEDSSLTNMAYDYSFTDIAHFSKTFKRFIGISPTKYKESIPLKKE